MVSRQIKTGQVDCPDTEIKIIEWTWKLIHARRGNPAKFPRLAFSDSRRHGSGSTWFNLQPRFRLLLTSVKLSNSCHHNESISPSRPGINNHPYSRPKTGLLSLSIDETNNAYAIIRNHYRSQSPTRISSNNGCRLR